MNYNLKWFLFCLLFFNFYRLIFFDHLQVSNITKRVCPYLWQMSKRAGFSFFHWNLKLNWSFFATTNWAKTCYNGWLDLFNVLRKKSFYYSNNNKKNFGAYYKHAHPMHLWRFILVITEGIVLRKTNWKTDFCFCLKRI